MPAKPGEDATIAVVGDGLGSLIVQSTAMYLGFAPDEVRIYGTSPSPVATYRGFAENLGQTVLRSESESHFLPADWPTFGQLNAWSQRRPSVLARSIGRRYNPGVSEVLAEAAVVAARLGWDDCRVPVRIGWVQREAAHFVLYDEAARFVGRAKHVMLAVGHGPLQFPAVIARARADPAIGDRIVQSYEPKEYAENGRYVIVGAGIASVNEWANALDIGAKVLALTRSPLPEYQDLNVPRCLFEAKGIDIFQALPFDERVAFLATVLKGTTPHRRSWEAKVRRGRAEGRFDAAIGEIDRVEPGPAGLRVRISSEHAEDPGWLDVTGVIVGTGFNRSALTIPLLRRLIEHYALPVEGGRIKLMTNCGVPTLDRADSRLCMMGLTANSVIPHGDTIAGLKYIGRRFVADCARAERLRRRRFPGRLAMQLRLAAAAAETMRTVRRTEQIA